MEMEEEGRMEIVNRNGRTYFIPAQDSREDHGTISNFSRWEQAFCIFSNIYCSKFPDRALELIQYNHIIHMAALTYTWDNVYLYDRDFRFHITKYPLRSWAVILQQSWMMRLKDRNKSEGGSGKSGKFGKTKFGRDVCWQYNSGHCSFGASCKFDHRCAICNKFRHGAHMCHKGKSKSKNTNGGKNDSNNNWQQSNNQTYYNNLKYDNRDRKDEGSHKG